MDSALTLDGFDRRILALLQVDCSLSVAEIADKVGLSASPCWRRIKRLEDEGVILRRAAVLDPERLGLGLMVFAHVKLSAHGRQNLSQFEAAVSDLPPVIECFTVSGEFDYLIKIVLADMRGYETFLRQGLLQMPAVQEVHTSFVITRVKATTALPLPEVP